MAPMINSASGLGRVCHRTVASSADRTPCKPMAAFCDAGFHVHVCPCERQGTMVIQPPSSVTWPGTLGDCPAARVSLTGAAPWPRMRFTSS